MEPSNFLALLLLTPSLALSSNSSSTSAPSPSTTTLSAHEKAIAEGAEVNEYLIFTRQGNKKDLAQRAIKAAIKSDIFLCFCKGNIASVSPDYDRTCSWPGVRFRSSAGTSNQSTTVVRMKMPNGTSATSGDDGAAAAALCQLHCQANYTCRSIFPSFIIVKISFLMFRYFSASLSGDLRCELFRADGLGEVEEGVDGWESGLNFCRGDNARFDTFFFPPAVVSFSPRVRRLRAAPARPRA